MTKFQLVSELTNITNALLLEGVNGCTIDKTRGYLDLLFDEFEEQCTTTKNKPGDLEHYLYIMDSLHEEGYNLWLADKGEDINKIADPDDITLQENDPLCQKLIAMSNALEDYEKEVFSR